MNVLASAGAIRRKSLHEELAGALRDLIVEGALAPGSKVPERELCARFSVSRTPLREALKVLAAEGLVVLEQNRGAWIGQITLAELEDVFPVMGALEALAGELAAARITPEELLEVERLHAAMMAEFEAGDLGRYFGLNQKIHEAILAAARNRTLANQYTSLASRVRRARYLANMTPARWRRATEEHERIVEALRRRDAAGLAAVLREHLLNKFQTVRDWIASTQAERAR